MIVWKSLQEGNLVYSLHYLSIREENGHFGGLSLVMRNLGLCILFLGYLFLFGFKDILYFTDVTYSRRREIIKALHTGFERRVHSELFMVQLLLIFVTRSLEYVLLIITRRAGEGTLPPLYASVQLRAIQESFPPIFTFFFPICAS